MIGGAIAIALIFSLAGLFAQKQAYQHEASIRGKDDALRGLVTRIVALEERAAAEFDPKAFEELKTKVETLRFAQGIRGAR